MFVFVELFLVSVFEDLLLFEYLANFVLIFPAFTGVLVATVDTFFTWLFDEEVDVVAAKLKTPVKIKTAKIPIAISLFISFDFLFIEIKTSLL